MSGGAPSLHERAEVKGLVAAEAERARAGSGRLVLLRGATGTGRTALLEAVAAHHSARGMRILRARCSAQDTATPFTVVRRLLGAQPEGTDGTLSEASVASVASVASDMFDARLWRLLRSHAAEGPLLLAVDDVHLADRPSRRWLTEASRRLDRLPVLLVATERSQYDIDPPPASLAHALPPDLVRAWTLAPLSADGAAAMLRSAPGADAPQPQDAPPDWVDACVRASAGSPLLLCALLDDLRATTGAGGALPAALPATTVPLTCADLYPGAYPAAVSWWLESAGTATAEVARALAALDGDEPPGRPTARPHADARDLADLLAGMAGADPARVTGWLTATTRLGLLRPDPSGRPRYAHPLLRDAVLSGWSSARRQAAHRRAAELMQRRGDRAEAVAGQLLRAPAVGAAWATGALLDAAAAAARGGRTADAVAFLRRALDEPMATERRATALTELGSLEFATVRSSAGIPRLAEAMRLSRSPREQVRAGVALGTALARRGEAMAAVSVLRDLGEHLSGHPELVRAVRSASALLSDHDRGVRQEVYRSLRDAADRSPGLVGPAEQALLVRYEATAGLTSAQVAMKRVRALLEGPVDPSEEPFLLGTVAAVAQWADELDEADRLVQRGLAWQRASLLHPMHHALLNTRADIAGARGHYPELLADRGIWQVTEGAPVRPDPANAHAHAVIALVETGRPREARLLAESFSLSDSHDSWELNRFLYARGILRAACGDPSGAIDDFLDCGRRQAARDVVSPVVTPWRTAAAECHLALGRPQAALALAEEETRLAVAWDTPRLMGRALRVLGAATGGRHGLTLTTRAVRMLRDAPSVDTELIWALITQGRQLTAAGERRRARGPLRQAAERAERLGAVRMLALADQALREGGARRTATARTGSDALTGSERRIAALAADGYTNPEIAELLHLARRTVETHLTSTYRKLGIRRRVELSAALSGAGETADTGSGV